MRWIRKHFVSIIVAIFLLLGISLLSYPTVSNYWNSFHQSRAITGYADRIAGLSDDVFQEMFDEAHAYNEKLAKGSIDLVLTEAEESEYLSHLDVDPGGIIGYVTIPKINIQLPIYLGIDDAILQTSIGHLGGTSLPVGGMSTHCVLTGHRGLSSARLFTDLDQMKETDTFSISVLNETLTYEVDQIRIVMPTDLSQIQIEKGKDYCTLQTCTPYGINTHRLLVRGHRVENPHGDAKIIADAIQIRPIYVGFVLSIVFLFILLILILIFTSPRFKNQSQEIKEAYLKNAHLSDH